MATGGGRGSAAKEGGRADLEWTGDSPWLSRFAGATGDGTTPLRWSLSCVVARDGVTRPARALPRSCGSTAEHCSASWRGDPFGVTLWTESRSHSVAIPASYGLNGSADGPNSTLVICWCDGGAGLLLCWHVDLELLATFVEPFAGQKDACGYRTVMRFLVFADVACMLGF